MKILLINDYATPTGGAELAILRLREELEKRGHEVKLFASSAQVTGQLPEADYSCYGTGSRFRTYLQTANFSAYFQLKKILKSWQPEVVHLSLFLTQLSPLILSLLENYPTLWHLHWYRGICPLGTKRLPSGDNCAHDYGRPCLSEGCLPLHQWLPLMWQMKYLEKHKNVFRRVVANTNFVKALFEKAGYRNIEVIWYGQKMAPQDNFQDFNPRPVIVFAGRLVKEKGVDLLLKAFVQIVAKSPDAILQIAGDGPEMKNLRELSDELKIEAQVRFLGFIDHHRLDDQLADAWAQVVPSTYDEPFGLTVIEGMRRGTPVVACRAGGISELIRHEETGLLTEKNEDDLARAVCKLIEQEDLRFQIRRRAARFARENFSIERYADNFLKIYAEMI